MITTDLAEWRSPNIAKTAGRADEPEADCVGIEETGRQAAIRFPLRDSQVVLCEAKVNVAPALIGQALVYSWYVKRAGA